MKKIILIALGLATMGVNAQQQMIKKEKMEHRVLEIEDKLALKELVDTFSNLADVKNVKDQLLLFTEDAVVETTNNGQVFTAKGRKEIGEAFSAYLALFDVVYHQNGQQVVTIKGNTATGVSYCQVVLIGNQNGTKTSHTSYVIYNDTYQKIDGKWYIKHRKSNFVWTKTENH